MDFKVGMFVAQPEVAATATSTPYIAVPLVFVGERTG